MLPNGDSFEEVRDRFSWVIPERYNIGVDVCDRWAARDPGRVALVHVRDDGSARDITFGELRDTTNRLANGLAARGVGRGDRVGILLPQAPETAYAHIAAYKLGAIAIPLFTLFGVEALTHRLRDAGASAVVTNAEGAAKLAAIRDGLPDLKLVVTTDGQPEGAVDLASVMAGQSDRFTPVDTGPDDPALIIYTSGTTGQPKGALHAHRVLLGHLPGVEISHDLFPQPGDRIWTPADWAWIGGLLDVLLPALHHGVPVVARRFPKFSAEAAFALLQDQRVRNAFIPPTALKMMRAVPDARSRWTLDLRTVASGGETLGAELLAWGRDVLGVTINEFYGQTECNMIVSSCGRLTPNRAGVMGRPVPGHDVDVIDASGRRCPDGTQGDIAVRRGDPVMFLGYWNNDAATRAKFRGDWLVTGDIGVREADGALRFVGRDDDVITSAGYRIGPGEIEDCLLRHPAVRLAGVVGKPDADRTEIVKAYVVVKEGVTPDPALAADIANHVKTRLAAHEYPREIEFVDDLPLTTTGKIIRRELRERARAGG
ncbi:acyl-CoA synthetase [Alsobacter sp. SYSU M60028]|uniref:Acyl-CoA synthetase n=1 Tax=Alsobacter ponti TaxID=2962936 RepID=A0ABT1LGI9_9HYPH|nr:acyl-CoA synthetase [Alsobacter ponti]MCP8940228.1 acyl-CoA synthetase [Alsobacter ponti]